MSSCTFFGHRDCPDEIKIKLRELLIDLIINHNVDMFYVGNQGRFDTIVRRVLRDLKQKFPRSITQWCWPTCPENRPSTTTIPTPCSRRASSPSTPAMPSPGAITGC